MRVWIRLLFVLIVTIMGSIHTGICVRLRPESERLAYKMMRQGVAARRFCRILGIHVTTDHHAKLSPGTLRVSNHLTVIDPIFLASQLDVCFAGKAEIARWPIIGWICNSYAMLLVDRRRRGQAKTFASQVRERLGQQGSVLVFPEGTTGDGQTLLPFKTGAFEGIRDWDQGRLQPIFMDVTAINGHAVEGREGRMAITQGSAEYGNSFVGRIRFLAGFRRLEIELRIGPILTTSGMDRKAISQVARDAILELSRNNPKCTE